MNTMKIAEAVKAHLVNLTINDKLPMDMTDLSEFGIEKVIKKAIKEQTPSKRQIMIDKAEQFLAYDNEVSTAEMIELIDKCEDENEIIDYIDGVSVWEKVEFSFTCEQFLEQIDFVAKDFYKKK